MWRCTKIDKYEVCLALKMTYIKRQISGVPGVDLSRNSKIASTNRF